MRLWCLIGRHDWEEWCPTDSCPQMRACKRCDKRERRDHAWTYSHREVTHFTGRGGLAMQDDQTHYTCEVCGQSKAESVIT